MSLGPPIRRFCFETKLPRTNPLRVFKYVNNLESLEKVTPPLACLSVVKDTRQPENLKTGEVQYRAFLGLFKQHVQFVKPDHPFITTEVLVNGSLAYWEHARAISTDGENTYITDSINYAYKDGIVGLISRLFINPLTLLLLFNYRQKATKQQISKIQ